jgi:hypothetical protein
MDHFTYRHAELTCESVSLSVVADALAEIRPVAPAPSEGARETVDVVGPACESCDAGKATRPW